MSERETVRILIERTAMYTIVEDMTRKGQRPKRHLDHPIAFWNTAVELWCVLDTSETKEWDLRYFNPLHDMNDAWLVFKHAVLGKPDHLADRKILSTALLGSSQDEVNAYSALGFLCTLTPERLCSAIFVAYGFPPLATEYPYL